MAAGVRDGSLHRQAKVLGDSDLVKTVDVSEDGGEPLFSEIVSARALRELPGLDPGVPRAWLDEHCARARDHGRALWSLFALCFWMHGPRRAHSAGAREARRQERGGSSSEATVLRSTEG